MEKQPSANHGEGDPEAAERFNVAERAFVDSARGKRAIGDGPQVRTDEETDLAKAEERARARSKGDDSTCLDELQPEVGQREL
jgi:hypothetical protein